MQISELRNMTKGDVFKYEYFLTIRNDYREKAADRIVNSIYNEIVVKRKGDAKINEFKKIAESIVPDSSIKETVVKKFVDQFKICAEGVCINQCHLKPNEPGEGIIPKGDEQSSDGSDDLEDDAQDKIMDTEIKSEGECMYCKEVFSMRGIGRHLESCKERAEENSKDNSQGKVFLLKAEADPFWVYFEANADERLSDIDQFLRDLWLECCGHLSAFTINGVYYNSDGPGDTSEKSMEHPLSRVLKVGAVFKHDYDFGTTTELLMKCVSARNGKLDDIEIIARNDPLDFKCCKCGKPAKEICTECAWDGDGLLCESCAKNHKCGEEMMLPVVNSPRMGMCGYTGE